MDGKHTALQDRIGGNPSVIRNVKFLNLCLLRTVFQGIGILPLGLHGSLGSIGPLLICFLGSCSLQVFIIQQTGSLFSHTLRAVILSHQYPLVGVDHSLGTAFAQDISLIQQIYTVTIFADTAQIMTDEHNGLAHLLEFFEFMITFCLEKYVTDTQSLIHDQDLRLDIDGHRKGQPDEHTAGISLHRLIDVISDIRKT